MAVLFFFTAVKPRPYHQYGRTLVLHNSICFYFPNLDTYPTIYYYNLLFLLTEIHLIQDISNIKYNIFILEITFITSRGGYSNTIIYFIT